jgi:hypothetical protein
MLSLIFCQVIFMSRLSYECSRAAEMFETSSLTYTLWDFWDWTSPYQTSMFLIYSLIASFWLSQPTDSNQNQSQLLWKLASKQSGMPSPFHEDATNMMVIFLVMVSQIVLVNVSMWKHCVLDRSFDLAMSTTSTKFSLLFSWKLPFQIVTLKYCIYFIVLLHWNLLPCSVLSAIVLQQFPSCNCL